MTCPKCNVEMDWVSLSMGSPYPMGHWVCPKCGLEISKK